MTSNESGEIIEELKHEKSISRLFTRIISRNMITIVAYYTNKRIANIKTSKIINGDRREKFINLKQDEISVTEIFAYIGLLILFGLGNKGIVAIDLLWSDNSLVHYSSYAAASMSRDRFQLISRYICFNYINTRENRKENKFHKMQDIFTMFKDALKLIIPSYYLCIDQTLYGFRGACSFRQFIPSKPARYGIKYWCLVDVKLVMLLVI
jgi:hypothetical protein